MPLRLILCLLVLAIFISSPSICQDSTANEIPPFCGLASYICGNNFKKYSQPVYYLSATANYGYIIKHRKAVQGIGNVYPKGLEFNIGYQTNGNRYWHQLHNFPRVGLQVLLYDLQRPKEFGYAIHFTPYMDLFLLKSKRHDLYIKIGTGLGFYSKHYDNNNNPENKFMGQTLCMTGVFSLNYRFQFTPNWSSITTLNFNHGSNGSLRQPNLGINIPSLAAGIHYTFHPERIQFKRSVLPDYKKSTNLFFSISFSSRQSAAEPLNDVNYFASTQSLALGQRISRKSALLVGLDACYDQSLRYNLRETPEYIARKYTIWRFATLIGYEFLLHEKFRVTFQNAFYLYDPYDLDVPVYQRLGFKYLPHKNLYFGYYLKTHVYKADFWEFAIGTRF